MIDAIDTTKNTSAIVGLGEEFNVTMGIAQQLSQTNIVPDSNNMSCPDVAMVENRDYTFNDLAGQFVINNNTVTITDGNFTSLFDTNVSLWTADNQLAIVNAFDTVVYNCTNTTDVFDYNADYFMYDNIPYIEVSSTWNMDNNTMYCYNTTGSITYDGASCTIDYQFYTGHDGVGGLTATIMDLLPMIFAIVLLVGIIGYMGIKA
jgi:hypothetical protein